MTKAELDKAVHAWQVYDGSLTSTDIRTQQKLYDQAMRRARSVAKKTGYDLAMVVRELTQAAASRGRVMPRPGQDY
ncbi:MAG TPA: hypothetical protein VGB13_10925 [Candidatus Krumholzibacteria bacterium]